MQNLILADRNDLKAALKDALQEHQKELEKRTEDDRLYTINSVARKLGKAHATVKKLVTNGLLKTTKDGLIPLSSINEYLGKK
jgi:hypothetical protein